MKSKIRQIYDTRHLGAVGILMPIFATQVVGLGFSQRVTAMRWLLALCLAIVSLNFAGISVHTLFAISIFPVLFKIHTLSDSPRLLSAIGLAVTLALV